MARTTAKGKRSTAASTTTAPVATKKAPATVAASSTLHVGVDLGTNTTVFQVSDNGDWVDLSTSSVLSVVGFPKAGIIPGIIPSDADMLFGDDAVEMRIHLDLKWPLKNGFVDDVRVCKMLTQHMRSVIDRSGKRKLWGVVGAPANATPEKQKELRATMVGVLDRLVIVPEPFLAAMGLREDPGFKTSGSSVDPTKHSLIVDIGAGTTDLCLVRGYYPTAEDQISILRAGDFMDEQLMNAVERRFPDLRLTHVTVTQLKEKNSYVGTETREALVKVYVDGRPQTLDFGELVHEACESIVPDIVSGIKELLKRCDSDSTEKILRNIIMTGGGSETHGLCERVQDSLRDDGFDDAVTRRPSEFKLLVARGALRIAENVREDQWQMPF